MYERMEFSNKEEAEYENSPIGKQNRIIYTNNLYEISICTGLYSLAHKNLAVIKELIEDSSFSQDQKNNNESIQKVKENKRKKYKPFSKENKKELNYE